MPIEESLKYSIIELYQMVKIRKQSDTKKIDKEYLDQEKSSLQTVSSLSLIDYIKVHLNLLINLKVSDKLSKLKTNPLDFISLYGSDLPANDYEKLLRRYEADIRNYIKLRSEEHTSEKLYYISEYIKNTYRRIKSKTRDIRKPNRTNAKRFNKFNPNYTKYRI